MLLLTMVENLILGVLPQTWYLNSPIISINFEFDWCFTSSAMSDIQMSGTTSIKKKQDTRIVAHYIVTYFFVFAKTKTDGKDSTGNISS